MIIFKTFRPSPLLRIVFGFNKLNDLEPMIILKKDKTVIKFNVKQWVLTSFLKNCIEMSFRSMKVKQNGEIIIEKLLDQIDDIEVQMSSHKKKKIMITIKQSEKLLHISQTEYKRICKCYQILNTFCLLSERYRKLLKRMIYK